MAGLQRCASHGGVIQSRGWLPKWKPLDIPGTQPPLSDAVVNLYEQSSAQILFSLGFVVIMDKLKHKINSSLMVIVMLVSEQWFDICHSLFYCTVL